MSRRLVVVPDSDRVEQWLLDESRHTDFVDLREVCTLTQLVERCDPAGVGGRAPADPLLVRFAFGRAAGQHAVSAFGAVAHTAEFAAQAQELVNQLRGQAVTARQLEAAAADAPESLRPRARALAAVWRAVDTFLEAQGLVDRADWWRLAAERVTAEGLPASLRGLELLEICHVHDVPPARLVLFEALATACSRAGVRFVWRWPGSQHAATDAFIVNAVREAEARWQSLEVELEVDVPDGPLAWVGQVAFSDEPVPRSAPELSAFCAPSTRDEVREIARRVRRQVSAGVPPEAIAVAFRDLADDTELLVEALSELGIPARARLGVPLAQSPVGRLVLSVLDLAEDGFPADAVATLLESRSVRLLDPEGSEPRRAFREAGVRDDEVGATGGRGAYAVRLEALALRSRDEGRRVRLLADAVARLVAACREVPAQGVALDLLESWWDVVSRLGLLDPARRGAVAPLPGSMAAEVDRSLARDQAAVESLGHLLSGLKEALVRSGVSKQFMSRADFARWVRLSFAETNLVARGPRAGAVWLLDVRELSGRHFAQLFLGGLLDGRFPGRPRPLPLLSEEERVALNQAAQRPLFRTSVGEGDVRLPTRLAEDRLLFHLALSSAASVTVSRARVDDGGRELLASPFRDALARCVSDFREEPLHRRAVPLLDEVQSEAELRVRVALEALGPPLTRQTVADARRGALAEVVRDEPWFQLARAHSQHEVERLRFFTDPQRAARPFTGQAEGDVLEALQSRLAFDAAHPISSHELNTWGSCAFRGLSALVLGLEGAERAGEELTRPARGSFWHEVLARAVPELDERGLLGSEDPAVRGHLEAAVAASAVQLVRTNSTGHPALWSLAQEWAVSVLQRIVTGPLAKPFGVAARPRYVEVRFGDPRAPEALREVKLPAAFASEGDVFFVGRMDRVDVGEGVVGVLDYKTNVSKSLGKDFLTREFQMALYLLAVRELVPGAVPTGAWLGLSKGDLKQVTKLLGGASVSELLAVDELSRTRLGNEGQPNLANAVHGLLGRLRSGDFGARPMDCEYCDFQSVCRISQRQLAEDGA